MKSGFGILWAFLLGIVGCTANHGALVKQPQSSGDCAVCYYAGTAYSPVSTICDYDHFMKVCGFPGGSNQPAWLWPAGPPKPCP